MPNARAYLRMEDDATNTRKHYFVAIVPGQGVSGSVAVMVAWGRIGNTPQEKAFGSYLAYARALTEYQKILDEKLGKGYKMMSKIDSSEMHTVPSWFLQDPPINLPTTPTGSHTTPAPEPKPEPFRRAGAKWNF